MADGEQATPVTLTSGLGETVLPPAPATLLAGLEAAMAGPEAQRREGVAAVVATEPKLLAGWATLGDLARDTVEAYACYRVGYHRGLDALRAAGWRGSGYVRGAHPSNLGFLRALDGLRRTAGVLGEHEEEERCALFLRQLDPDWGGSS